MGAWKKTAALTFAQTIRALSDATSAAFVTISH
jgi:hypothetical protein